MENYAEGRLTMFANNETNDTVIYKTDDGICIRYDADFSEGLEEEIHQKCIALKEEKMGYGLVYIFGSHREDIAVYADDDKRHEVLSRYYDIAAKDIIDMLNSAKNEEDYIDVAVTILSACTSMLIGLGIEDLDKIDGFTMIPVRKTKNL